MPVGGSLTPRANCAGVRNPRFSGFSHPFVQGAHGKPTGQGEEQNHRPTQGTIPNHRQLGPAPIPGAQQSLVVSLPHAGTYPQDMEQPELPETAAPFGQQCQDHTREEPGLWSAQRQPHNVPGREGSCVDMELARSGWNCACPFLPILPAGAQNMSPQAPYSQTRKEGTRSPSTEGKKGGWYPQSQVLRSSQPGCWRSSRILASHQHTELAFTVKEFLLVEAFFP